MKHTLDARRDTLDFRDRMYVPTLVEVPTERPIADFRRHKLPILDQGNEGACTGFGLAAVAQYLLATRLVKPDREPISPHMFYNLARRYDEWPGERYSGSSARGALKGWHKHGVASLQAWERHRHRLVPELLRDAVKRPLGAYFRVNHKDVVAMHAAISEVGALYAEADVHSGWDNVKADGRIPFVKTIDGGHAFAIVGYDVDGFWIQNSWGADWGFHGFCHISYDDWLANGCDVWVMRLGAPVHLDDEASAGATISTSRSGSAGSNLDLKPHIVSLGNNGLLRDSGPYGTNLDELDALFEHEIDRLAAERNWGAKRRILLYAHGGLVPEESAIQRVADYLPKLLDAGIYPIAFNWKTDYWTTLGNILQDALRQRKSEGILDAAKDFLIERLDDGLEAVARHLTGMAEWQEMKENALLATMGAQGGARLLAERLQAFAARHAGTEIHLVGHSAGSILLAPLLMRLTSGIAAGGALEGRTLTAPLPGLGLNVASATLWAPACTTRLFKQTYAAAAAAGALQRFTLFTMTDKAELDDNCAGIYRKSLLYLVSHACEERPRVPGMVDAKGRAMKGEPLLGMAAWVDADREIKNFFARRPGDWIQSPNDLPVGSPDASGARCHGGFDDDPATVSATLARIMSRKQGPKTLRIHRSEAGRRDIRHQLQRAVGMD